jgi:poly(hydroxyalkanoate) depolymerase family esterase
MPFLTDGVSRVLRKAFGGLGLSRASKPRPSYVAPGRFVDGRYTGSAGTRAYKLYVPTRPAAAKDSRLVVMLHGCGQTPNGFAAGTHMNVVAQERGWFALYPEQSKAANLTRCWNWFSPANQSGERGEPAILAAMAREIMAERDIRAACVGGLSAGAAMALILGETHPELFDAVLAHSGVAPGAARDLTSALAAMKTGAVDVAPRPFAPRLMLVHGLEDTTVAPPNADAIETFAARDGAKPRVGESVENGRTVERREVRDADGRLMIVSLRVAGLGHAWSGASAPADFFDPLGPDVSELFARFVEP